MQLGENQKKFVAALRAPRLKQCRNFLYTDSANNPQSRQNAECCCTLGLALDIFDIHETRSSKIYTTLNLTDESAAKLVDMNDVDGLTFAQIADKIEAAPADFFTESK